MMTSYSFCGYVRWWLLTIAFVFAGQSQILQNQPELCGNPSHPVALPEGTSFGTADGLPANLTLKLKDGTTKSVDLGLASGVLQVCPIAGDRLLVFVSVLGEDGPHVSIVSQRDGTVLDRIGSRDPVVSPDQHWIVYRRFYPPHVQVPDEAYMLYDLNRDAAGNRPPEIDPRFPRPSGRQIYPVTTDHFARRYDEVLEPTHAFESESFYWSADSHFVVLADTTNGGSMSIVLVKVDESGPTAYVHALREGEVCASRTDLRGTLRAAVLHSVEFLTSQAPLPDVWATFSGVRCDEPLRLHSQDFKPAEVEVHERLRQPRR